MERERYSLSSSSHQLTCLRNCTKGTRTTDVSNLQSTERERERKRFVLPLTLSIGSQWVILETQMSTKTMMHQTFS